MDELEKLIENFMTAIELQTAEIALLEKLLNDAQARIDILEWRLRMRIGKNNFEFLDKITGE